VVPTRLLVVSQDRIGPQMAGPAIRSVELARSLARENKVKVITPYRTTLSGEGFEIGTYETARELKAAVADHDVLLVFGSLLLRYPFVARSDKVIIADLYDPAMLEALIMHERDPMARQLQIHDDALAILQAQLTRADLVLCASDRQRHLLLGLLMSLGRINPATYAADPNLNDLVRIVPFGLPPAGPSAPRPGPLRTRLGLSADSVVILWGGGIYEWLDPLLLIEVMADLSDDRVKVFFMGMSHPTPDVAPMPVAARVLARSQELGLTDRSVFFGDDWVPYADRASYLRDADIGVSLHRDNIETAFAFRTRILDYIWAGLPIVCSEGDTFAETVKTRGLGEVIPVGDSTALKKALLRLVNPATRQAHTVRLREVAEEFRWDRVAEPIMEFCRAPVRAPDQLAAYRKLHRRVRARRRAHAAVGAVVRWARAGRTRDQQAREN
jgi:glycosyltransferase involved in cell wall biosynthesis